MKKRRTIWIETVVCSNGFIRSGIVWNNNKVKHDVIRLQMVKIKNKKYVTDNFEVTVDEAVLMSYLLNKAVFLYLSRSKEDIRSWEYKKDEIPTDNI
jgi:hypothetical protein